MAGRFKFGDSNNSVPFTPDKRSRGGGSLFALGKEPSTTPAGPPPSSSQSFTPAGAPSASYMGSSIMGGGLTGQKQSAFGGNRPAGKTLFAGRGEKKPTSSRPSRGTKPRGPSSLSQSYRAESAEPDSPPAKPTGTFQLSFDDDEDDDDDDDEEDEEEDGYEGVDHLNAEIDQFLDEDLEAEHEDADGDDDDNGEDMFLNMRHPTEPYANDPDDNVDLMVLTTPAADDRVRREAENIFRASAIRHRVGGRKRDFRYDNIARELYNRLGPAVINESADIILGTEERCMRLYKEGVGAKDDADLLDSAIARTVDVLLEMWMAFAAGLSNPDEHATEIGPSDNAESFKKAEFIANLVLHMHHTRFETNFEDGNRPPLPEILFQWMHDNHNPYPDQTREVKHHHPSPASHALYWQTVRTSLVRGEAAQAANLLRAAGFEHVRKNRGRPEYTGKSLENIEYAVQLTCEMLESCPGLGGNWNIWSSEWTLFRVKASASLNQLQRFAEGKDRQSVGSSQGSFQGQDSLAGMARQAGSQIPWDIYEQLNTIYDIALGEQGAILDTAQDWCEATIGLCGWWDDEKDRRKKPRLSQNMSLMQSTHNMSAPGDYFDRLALAFHTAVESDFHFNPVSAVQVALASAFEGNFAAIVGILRSWSLPVASAVAEIGALGKWLPKPEPPNILNMDAFDDDDMQVLGMPQQGSDELNGVKDTTLLHYAREVAGIEDLDQTGEGGEGGWYMAIELLGRMDSIEGSEDAVGELLHDIIGTFQEDSQSTVDKILKMLNDLGMQNFAEETAEAFADLLSRESHRYGKAIWYYARAHKADKVRDVLNLLMSYSLVNSTPYPSRADLDAELGSLLLDRGAALERLASLDLEAAQLVGRMLAGYATLRRFYELRDECLAMVAPPDGGSDDQGGRGGGGNNPLVDDRTLPLRRQAAAALVAVVASADDNIRGGLYDASRDAVVAEDFLLALVGEALPLIDCTGGGGGGGHHQTRQPVISLEQMDVLLKAVEDVQTVGSGVYSACDDFFQVVLASAGQAIKGATPASLMQQRKKGAGGGSGTGGMAGSSYVMTGSSMLASQLHRSISAAAAVSGGAPMLGKDVKRGWDWRSGLRAGATAEDVLRMVRLGLSRDLASLWLREADNVALF